MLADVSIRAGERAASGGRVAGRPVACSSVQATSDRIIPAVRFDLCVVRLLESKG